MSFSKAVDIYFVGSLVLFAYSGLIKWLFVFVDPTIFFLLLCMPAFLLLIKRGFYIKNNPVAVIIPVFLSFNFFMILTSVYSISEKYYILKSFSILSNTIAFILPLLILRSERTFDYFRFVIKGLLLLCILLLTYEYLDNQFTRIRFREEYGEDDVGLPNYLTFSYFLGTCIILLISSKGRFNKGMCVVALLYMVLLAAKGPLLFLITIMTIKYWKEIRIENIKLWMSLFWGGAISYLFAVLTGVGVFDTLMNRLIFFSGGLEADDSSLVRLILISKGIELILENMIFGVGIGGYSVAIGEPDGRLSPHNLFIEVWAEAGIISTILLVTLCVLFFMKYRYLLKRYDFFLGRSLIYLCLFIFLSNMVSSYLEDMRTTYFWLGVSIAYYTMKIKSNQNKRELCAELVE